MTLNIYCSHGMGKPARVQYILEILIDCLFMGISITLIVLRAWESLPEYGVSLFVVKFHGEKKEELLVSHLF